MPVQKKLRCIRFENETIQVVKEKFSGGVISRNC